MSAQPYDLSSFKQELENYLSALENTRKQYLDTLAQKQFSEKAVTKSEHVNAHYSEQVWTDVAVLDYYSQRYRQIKTIMALLSDPSMHAIWPRLTRFLGKSTYQAILDEQSIQVILEAPYPTDYKLDTLREKFAGTGFQSQFKKIQAQQSRDITIITMTMLASAAGIIVGVVLLHHVAAVIFAIAAMIALFVLIGVSLPALTFKKGLQQEVKKLADVFAEDNHAESSFSLSNKKHHYKINEEMTIKSTIPPNFPPSLQKTFLKNRFYQSETTRFFNKGNEEAGNNNRQYKEIPGTTIQKDVENEYTRICSTRK